MTCDDWDKGFSGCSWRIALGHFLKFSGLKLFRRS